MKGGEESPHDVGKSQRGERKGHRFLKARAGPASLYAERPLHTIGRPFKGLTIRVHRSGPSESDMDSAARIHRCRCGRSSIVHDHFWYDQTFRSTATLVSLHSRSSRVCTHSQPWSPTGSASHRSRPSRAPGRRRRRWCGCSVRGRSRQRPQR